MIGRKNIVFGFLYLVITAALGPYMVTQLHPDVGAASQERQQSMARLEKLEASDFEEDLEALSGEEIARANTEALLAQSAYDNTRAPIDGIKSGPHAHGNLEALLNIAVGIALVFIAVAPMFKQVISWVFIVGALLHSGVLYLTQFGVTLGGLTSVLQPIGPPLVLLGLLLAGIAAAMGWRGEPVRD
ncbi:hypothetical protein [Thiohalospira sp.]|uniref:hypothetical protein n=1 Tax=Thiohalospira sp. TaxID=3080549 RepID=UPI00397F9B90